MQRNPYFTEDHLRRRVADAIAYQPIGLIDLVVDWKTDVNPSVQQTDLYREQMRDYLVATGAPEGLLIFVTTGQFVRVQHNFHLPPATANAAQQACQTPSPPTLPGEDGRMPVIDRSFWMRVLLVGAGFSGNWGGLLASEVSGRILSHSAVLARPALGQLILHEPSFEDALEKSRGSPFEPADAAAIETAITAVFDEMDADYKNPNPPVLGATINDFIGRFCPGAVGIGTGYVFSLNQDLLLERIYGTIVTRQKLAIPGITWRDRPPLFPAGAEPIPLATVLDPSAGEPQLLRNFSHIKLHGSINWRSSDGSSSMVMGRRKLLTIARFPLIDWYHRVFEQVLFSSDVR